MRELEDLLVNRDENVPLDVAALQLASVEQPDLDVTWFVEVLDSHARELEETTDPGMPGDEWVEAANEYLFGNLGFTGNKADYDNPRNSCLNDVLVTRTGIPITLSLVYMEIARRHGREVHGIGMPGHFLVRYQDRDYSAFIDPFHRGRILDAAECRLLSMATSGIDIASVPGALNPVTKWRMVIRMLDNLRRVYYKSKSYDKALRVLDLYLSALPDAAEEYRQRGVVYLHLDKPREAVADWERYLELDQSDSPERRRVREHVDSLRRAMRMLH